MDTISGLRLDPAFRQLKVQDQLAVADRIISSELNNDPAFTALPWDTQAEIKRRLTASVATFNDSTLEPEMHKIGEAYVSGNELGKQTREFFDSTVANSGILGFVDKITDPTKQNSVDRVRALDYYSSLERLTGKSDSVGAWGALTGTILDVAGTSFVMSPFTKAAASAIDLAARGGSKALATAAAAGLKQAPIQSRALAILGPAASESLIEALPYYLLDEQKRLQNGQASLASQGAAEVAKSLGANAAIDFALGSAMLAVLQTSWKTGKAVFGDSGITVASRKDAETMERMLFNIESGIQDTSVLDQLDPFNKALANQHITKTNFLRKNLTDIESDPWGYTSFLSHNLGKVVSKTDDGFSLYELTKKGAPIERKYTNILDVEDYLSYKYYKYANEVRPKDPLAAVRPELKFSYDRGERLSKQEDLFSADNLKKTNPGYFSKTEKLPEAVRNPLRRPFITRAEAYSVSKMNSDGITIQTSIPLEGSIVEAANSSKINLMRSSGPIRVRPHDTPNAMLIGTKAATPEAYALATLKAQKIILTDSFRSLDDARAGYLLNEGFDYFAHPDGSFEFFSPRNLKLIGNDDDILKVPSNPFLKGPASTTAIVSEVLKGTAKASDSLSSPDLVLEGALKSLRSSDPESLNNFSKYYLSANGSKSNVSIKYSASKDPIKVTKVSDDLIEINVGRRSNSYLNEKTSIKHLIDGLNSTLGEDPKRAITGDFFATKMQKNPLAFGLPENVDKFNWVKQVSQDLGGSLSKVNDTFILKLPSGERLFKSIDEAVSHIALKTLDQTSVIQELLDQGVRIVKTPSGSWTARSLESGKHLASSSSFDELLTLINYQPSKLDIRYGPKFVSLSPEGLTYELAGSSYFSNTKSALKAISQFENSGFVTRRKVLQRKSGKFLSSTPAGTFTVKLPDYDYVATFDNLADAKAFFATTSTTIDDLREMASKKFLSFDIVNGKYHLQDAKTIHEVGSLDDLKTLMSKYPDISDSVPDLIKLDPSVEQALPDLIKQYQAQQWLTKKAGKNAWNLPPSFPVESSIKELSAFKKLTSINNEFFSWLDAAALQMNIPFLTTWGNKVKLKLRLYNVDKNNIVHYLESTFRDEKGRILSGESRRKIYYHLGAEQGTEAAEKMNALYKATYTKELAPLTTVEERAASELRELYKRLGSKFGIDYFKLINHYMPRIRDYSQSLSQEARASLTDMHDLLRSMPEFADGHLPAELKFWAENERISELPNFFLKDDAFEVALMYATSGLKKFHLNDEWKQIDRHIVALQKSGVNVDDWHTRIFQFKEALMGGYRSDGEKFVADLGASVFRNLKDSPIGKALPFSKKEMESFGRNLLSNAMSLNYFVNLSWKPFLAIRNTMQIYTTLAPRFGLEWTIRSQKEILDNPEKFYKIFREKGILSDKAPIVNSFFGESRVGDFTRAGFKWFKNSDDLTRAMAYHIGDLRLSHALNLKLVKPELSLKEFMSEAGLDRINKTTASEILTLIDNKNIDAAKDKFGDVIQRATMFDYSGATTPAMYRGFVGKLFGQYGTYSAGYLANLVETFKYATPAQQLESAAAYLALNGLLWTGFNQAGIKTNDFIPLAPAIFNGGPAFDIAVNMTKATALNFEGEQARAALKRDLPTFIPGSAQYKAVSKFLSYMESGEYYKASLSLLSAPVTD